MRTTQRAGPATRQQNVWVVTHRTGFAVRFEGRRCTFVRGLTQQSAVRIARVLARELGSELLVQGEHGRIRFRDSHGNDPFPPAG